jgi:hypothetical protein
MSQKLIEELRRENLCTHFILPLLKLSKFSFVTSNFMNSYLAQDSLPSNTRILAQVIDLSLVNKTIFKHKDYLATYKDVEGYYYLSFKIPDTWITDVTYFRTGRFSRMSEMAKDYIKRYSQLPYQQKGKEGTETDGRLLALDRHEKLKAMWENVIGTSLKDEDELLSIPGEESYTDVRTLVPLYVS